MCTEPQHSWGYDGRLSLVRLEHTLYHFCRLVLRRDGRRYLMFSISLGDELLLGDFIHPLYNLAFLLPQDPTSFRAKHTRAIVRHRHGGPNLP